MFTPCEFAGEVYLCGGETKLVEVFTLTTRQFRPTALLSLPEESATVAWVADGRLTVISSNMTTRVNLSVPHPRGETETHKYVVVCANCTPVVFQGTLWWVKWANCLSARVDKRPVCVRTIC